MLAQRFRAKGGVTMAPIGGGFALPHPSTRVTLGRDSGTMALILLRDAAAAAEPRVDEVPVTRLLFFIAPSPRAHLDMVGRISRLLSAPDPARSAGRRARPDDGSIKSSQAADRGGRCEKTGGETHDHRDLCWSLAFAALATGVVAGRDMPARLAGPDPVRRRGRAWRAALCGVVGRPRIGNGGADFC